jgi:hypothetical protein
MRLKLVSVLAVGIALPMDGPRKLRCDSSRAT